MNPFVKALVGSGARWLLTVAAAQGFVVTEDQTLQLINAGVLLATLLWSGYQKHRTDVKITEARTGV